jgi:hypothetical protein
MKPCLGFGHMKVKESNNGKGKRAIFAVTKGHSNVGLKGGQKTVSPMGKACFGVRK